MHMLKRCYSLNHNQIRKEKEKKKKRQQEKNEPRKEYFDFDNKCIELTPSYAALHRYFDF